MLIDGEEFFFDGPGISSTRATGCFFGPGAEVICTSFLQILLILLVLLTPNSYLPPQATSAPTRRCRSSPGTRRRSRTSACPSSARPPRHASHQDGPAGVIHLSYQQRKKCIFAATFCPRDILSPYTTENKGALKRKRERGEKRGAAAHFVGPWVYAERTLS